MTAGEQAQAGRHDRVTAVVATWAEAKGRPTFLATATPTLSWQVTSETRHWLQAACEIELARGGQTTTALLASRSSQAVTWPFAPLAAYETVSVRVRVRGDGEEWSPYGAAVELRTGPLGGADWKAPFVIPVTSAPRERAAARFWQVFEPTRAVRSAVLSVTAHGIYEAVLNGAVVGDEVFAPGWSAYRDRLCFQSYDVTAMLAGGRNVVGAVVADGWYRERFGFAGHDRIVYDGPAALSAQLRILYEDGSIGWVLSDGSWSASWEGPVVSSSIYQGEHYDARQEDDAFSDPDAVVAEHAVAVIVPTERGRLVPASAPPIRRIERRAPVAVTTSPSGRTIVDFGQDLVGVVELDVDAPEGCVVTLRHAEVLEDGELCTRPLRAAAATDSYTASGRGPARWSPRFTFHGFRYVEVSGWPRPLEPGDLRAVVVHSDLVRTGWLTTGDALLDKLHDNVVWSMRGNMVGLPTDCPQRDERLGWTGDIGVFAATATYLYDCSALLGSWLVDLRLEQDRRGGIVPFVVPDVLGGEPTAAAAWGDAATIVPDALYRSSGDTSVLAASYPSMRGWVEVLERLAGGDDLWTGGFQFGDWLDPAAPPDDPAKARTDPDIVATAYDFRSTSILAATALLLGRADDAARYSARAARIRDAFVATYVTPAGRIVSDASTAYALAICFGLLEDEAQRARAGDRLAELVRAYGYRIQTGFVGTPLVCDALCATGHVDAAYRLLTETGCPSWLYPVTMGATTTWERWDSLLPDGRVNPGEMTSFNHYALGAVADWMHRRIGGIAPAEPGYRVVDIAPVPGGGLQHVSARLDSAYGTIAVVWSVEDEQLNLRASIPANVEARVALPGSAVVVVGSGVHEWTVPARTGDGPAGRSRAGGGRNGNERRSFDLGSSLADVVEDPAARAALEKAAAAAGFPAGASLSDKGMWRSDNRLRDVVGRLPADDRERIVATLARIGQRDATT